MAAKNARARAAIERPMAIDAVAAGEGALSTWILPFRLDDVEVVDQLAGGIERLRAHTSPADGKVGRGDLRHELLQGAHERRLVPRAPHLPETGAHVARRQPPENRETSSVSHESRSDSEVL